MSGDDYHEVIECAVRADGSSPGRDFIAALRNGSWTTELEEEQIHDHFKLLAKIEYLGQNGEPRKRDDVKHLEDGVWELRHGIRRWA